MKSVRLSRMVFPQQSRPAWGGWIEIRKSSSLIRLGIRSRPAWGGWIEIILLMDENDPIVSRPAWGGWIEIWSNFGITGAFKCVPPRMGRVD